MNASHVTNMCCEVNLKYFTLFQACGVDVELRIGIMDDWVVDWTDTKVTDHTIDLYSLLEVVHLKFGSQNCLKEQRQMRLVNLIEVRTFYLYSLSLRCSIR